MLSKRTIIGLIVGIGIIILGGASLILHLGLHTNDFQDVIEVGAPARYTIPAPIHTPQSMKITGDTFDLNLESPGNGLQIINQTGKDEMKLDWVHLIDGETIIQIQNTGNTELEITGVITTSYEPVIFYS